MPTISRQEHAALFGPTVGDKIRLGDTDLFVEIEKDLRHYGDESMYGGGKTLRGGMGGDARLNRDAGVLDLVITNVTVIGRGAGRHQSRRGHPGRQDRGHRQERQPVYDEWCRS